MFSLAHLAKTINMTQLPRYCNFFVLLCFISPCFAQEKQRGVWDLSIDELLAAKVVTASKKEEASRDAPAVISVIRAEDLQQWGVDSLYEAISFIPGVTLTESYFGKSVLNFRGNLPGHYNNKSLLLINGHPYFEKANGTYHLELVPINAIKRIEVIRGPGSVLYGTNAFSGVINVITWGGDEVIKGQRNIAIAGGAYGRQDGSLLLGNKRDQTQWTFAVNHREDDGFPYSGVLDEPSGSGREPVNFDYFNEYQNIFFGLEHKSWNLNAGYLHQKKAKFGINPEVNWGGPNHWRSFYVDLGYQHKWGESHLSSRIRVDRTKRKMHIGEFPSPDAFGRDDTDTAMSVASTLWAGEIQYTTKLSRSLSLITALVHEEYKSDPYLFVFTEDNAIHPFSAYREAFKADDTSVLFEAKWSPRSQTAITAGLRYNTNADVNKDVLVPRLAGVFSFSQKTNLKVLLGRAFRNPDFFEKHVDTVGILYGDPDLDRETISTLDVSLDYQASQHYLFNLTAYALRTDDLIVRRTATGDRVGTEYFNGEGHEVIGLEFELNGQMSQQFKFFANGSLKDGKELLDDGPLLSIAKVNFNLGARQKLGHGFECSSTWQYLGPRAYNSQLDGEGKLGSYSLLNLRLALIRKDWSVSILGKNVLNKDYLYPENIRRVISALPGGPGFQLFLRAKYHF